MAGKDWKCREIARNDWDGLKWLDMAGYGWEGLVGFYFWQKKSEKAQVLVVTCWKLKSEKCFFMAPRYKSIGN